jgi:hypothetical protein
MGIVVLLYQRAMMGTVGDTCSKSAEMLTVRSDCHANVSIRRCIQ